MLAYLLIAQYAATAAYTTFCNPVDISYRFSMNKPSHREAADPTMVVHNGTYFLFPSKSGGYWHTKDLSSWDFVTPTGLPLEDYAPMVVVIGEEFFYTAFDSKAIFKTADIYGGHWTKVSDIGAYGDPGMLVDDDGKVFMYFGCSRNGNITGVELDPKNGFKEVSNRKAVVVPDYKTRGFETTGDNNELDQPAFVEGAFMNKINGSYFLQYAVPGTQYKTYADGLFVSTAGPMGPFTFQPHSPYSFKPTGFVAGAGHSSTFWSPVPGAGYYHVATSTISVRAMFERRVGIFPVNVAADNSYIQVNTYMGDYPQPLPTTAGGGAGGDPRIPQWMLLSYNKRATASTTLPNGTFSVANAFDEDIRTWWSASSGTEGEWLAVELGDAVNGVTVNAVQLNFADQGSTLIGARPAPSDAYKYYVEYSTDACATASESTVTWQPVKDIDMRSNTKDRPHAYFELSAPLTGVKQIRVTNVHMPVDSFFSLSGFRVFGKGAGAAPAAVGGSITATRNATDQRRVAVSWAASAGADFYIVRYGVASSTTATAAVATSTLSSSSATSMSASSSSSNNVLPYHYQIYDGTTADIRSLVAGVKYTFVVDAVNENGVTAGKDSNVIA